MNTAYGNRNFWVGFGVSAIFLVLFFTTLDPSRLLRAISTANYWYVVPGVVFYLGSIFFRAFRWKILLAQMKEIPVSRLYPVVVIGYMANNLLPMRLGELVRGHYVGEREGISKISAVITIIIERIFDAMILLIFVATAAFFVPIVALAEGFEERSGIYWPILVTGFSLPFVISFGVLIAMAFRPAVLQRLGILVLKISPSRLSQQLEKTLGLLVEGLSSLRSSGTVLILFVLSVPIWLLEGGLFYMIGLGFELNKVYNGPFEMMMAMVLVMSIANLGSSVPSAPGGIGLFELVARETLVLLPLAVVDRSIAGAYVTVVHVALLLPMIILGQLFLWAQHLSLRAFFSKAPHDG